MSSMQQSKFERNTAGEMNSEKMDQCDSASADSQKEETNDVREEVIDDPMPPAEKKSKIDTKSVVPEPIKQDKDQKDKEKKCCKYRSTH